jgi:hypothetical protein
MSTTTAMGMKTNIVGCGTSSSSSRGINGKVERAMRGRGRGVGRLAGRRAGARASSSSSSSSSSSGDGFGSQDDWGPSTSSTSSSALNKQLVESLAKAFLSPSAGGFSGGGHKRAPRARCSARAWLVDETPTRDFRASEMEVANPNLFSSADARALAFYKELAAHKRAVVVATLHRPTILSMADATGASVAVVDAELATVANEIGLANYCDSCPLRDSCSCDESESSMMCGFECAVRDRLSTDSSKKTTYHAVVFRDQRGALEEYLLQTTAGAHTVRRAKFSASLSSALGLSIN